MTTVEAPHYAVPTVLDRHRVMASGIVLGFSIALLVVAVPLLATGQFSTTAGWTFTIILTAAYTAALSGLPKSAIARLIARISPTRRDDWETNLAKLMETATATHPYDRCET